MKVGVTSGNSYHPSFWEAFPYQDPPTNTKLNAQLDGAPSLDMNLFKLAKNNTQLYPVDRTVGLYNLAVLKKSEPGKNIEAIVPYENFVLFSKKYPMPFAKKSDYKDARFADIQAVAQAFEKELKAMKVSGEYEKIRSKWLK